MNYVKLKKSYKRFLFGLLVKWLNTPPSQGGIHGSESRTDHHILILYWIIPVFSIYKWSEVYVR